MEPPKRTTTVLACCPAQVRDLSLGYSQLVPVGDLSFIHLHLPSGGWSGAAVESRKAMLHCLRSHLQGSVLPAAIEDFNCVISQIDTEASLCSNHKFSQESSDIVRDVLYIDAFCVLFLIKVQFSSNCRGKSSSCLEHLYLPPFLQSRFHVALYVPAVSDHHAIVIRLKTTGIATIPPAPPPLPGLNKSCSDRDTCIKFNQR